MSSQNFSIYSISYTSDYSKHKTEHIQDVTIPKFSSSYGRKELDLLDDIFRPLCTKIFDKKIEQTDVWTNVGIQIKSECFSNACAVEYKSNFDNLRNTKHTTIGHLAFIVLEFLSISALNEMFGAEFIIFTKKTRDTKTPQLSMRIYTSTSNIDHAIALFPNSCTSYKKILNKNGHEKSEFIKRSYKSQDYEFGQQPSHKTNSKQDLQHNK